MILTLNNGIEVRQMAISPTIELCQRSGQDWKDNADPIGKGRIPVNKKKTANFYVWGHGARPESLQRWSRPHPCGRALQHGLTGEPYNAGHGSATQ